MTDEDRRVATAVHLGSVGGATRVAMASRTMAPLLPVLRTIGAAAAGAAAAILWRHWRERRAQMLGLNPTTDSAKGLVWTCIAGALQASQLFLGDKLDLYASMKQLCSKNANGFTVIDLATSTGLHVRWLREWCAQQAAMGVLTLLDGEGDDDADLRYTFPSSFAEVLADPTSPNYDIAMIQAVPSLLARARDSIPEAFRTGLGMPYDDANIASAIDRQHTTSIHHFVIPKLLPSIAGGRVLAKLESGARVADLGCGGGNLLIEMARRFPFSEFHGYEVSSVAIDHAKKAIAAAALRNAHVHDAREAGASLGETRSPFDLILTYDVLHDAPQPQELIAQARRALAPRGVWLIADIKCADGVRANMRDGAAKTYWAFSTCLCMASALSEPGGAGLGTLGFSPSVAQRMLRAAGFGHVAVVANEGNQRWWEAAATDPTAPCCETCDG